MHQLGMLNSFHYMSLNFLKLIGIGAGVCLVDLSICFLLFHKSELGKWLAFSNLGKSVGTGFFLATGNFSIWTLLPLGVAVVAEVAASHFEMNETEFLDIRAVRIVRYTYLKTKRRITYRLLIKKASV